MARINLSPLTHGVQRVVDQLLVQNGIHDPSAEPISSQLYVKYLELIDSADTTEKQFLASVRRFANVFDKIPLSEDGIISAFTRLMEEKEISVTEKKTPPTPEEKREEAERDAALRIIRSIEAHVERMFIPESEEFKRPFPTLIKRIIEANVIKGVATADQSLDGMASYLLRVNRLFPHHTPLRRQDYSQRLGGTSTAKYVDESICYYPEALRLTQIMEGTLISPLELCYYTYALPNLLIRQFPQGGEEAWEAWHRVQMTIRAIYAVDVLRVHGVPLSRDELLEAILFDPKERGGTWGDYPAPFPSVDATDEETKKAEHQNRAIAIKTWENMVTKIMTLNERLSS